ncbi:hypothetical protein V1505DRAFT_358853 [Lipomyces doorenjongii]
MGLVFRSGNCWQLDVLLQLPWHHIGHHGQDLTAGLDSLSDAVHMDYLKETEQDVEQNEFKKNANL